MWQELAHMPLPKQITTRQSKITIISLHTIRDLSSHVEVGIQTKLGACKGGNELWLVSRQLTVSYVLHRKIKSWHFILIAEFSYLWITTH